MDGMHTWMACALLLLMRPMAGTRGVFGVLICSSLFHFQVLFLFSPLLQRLLLSYPEQRFPILESLKDGEEGEMAQEKEKHCRAMCFCFSSIRYLVCSILVSISIRFDSSRKS
ncbi:hypothetical protein F5B22DRAFT_63059 [Xylaria bambusicola]|uniref:uncharacterized protein n=1 Tax=Xylaria bambusicola TaxID=326684 RepID=UPI002008569E|nr:uncharacterized protein F5B22DRAFT_63059 [Xylaria bambusicola]KAI0518444.1 hypothetical protein F5B22DRAFT_63059 [Xylaria bambusicola]